MAEDQRKYGNADAEAEVKYYDMLYDFASVVTKANEQSFEGLEPKRIADTLRRSAEAFCRLCMIETITEDKGKNEVQKVSQDHKEKPIEPNTKGISDQQKEEKPIPDNFLRIDANGWGLCPVCHSKVLRVTSTTRLENFPVFCKRCRADHLVNWWNADNQRILYKRYVNERYFKDQAYKGTSLHSFKNTGTSAPERIVINA